MAATADHRSLRQRGPKAAAWAPAMAGDLAKPLLAAEPAEPGSQAGDFWVDELGGASNASTEDGANRGDSRESDDETANRETEGETVESFDESSARGRGAGAASAGFEGPGLAPAINAWEPTRSTADPSPASRVTEQVFEGADNFESYARGPSPPLPQTPPRYSDVPPSLLWQDGSFGTGTPVLGGPGLLAAVPETHGQPLYLLVTAAVLIMIVCAVAVAAGVGGGGVYVPILVLAGGFSTHEATALSQALVCGGSFAAFLLNLRSDRVPRSLGKPPSLDVAMVFLLGPVQLSGACLGVQLHHLLPGWLIAAFSALSLIYAGVQLARRPREKLGLFRHGRITWAGSATACGPRVRVTARALDIEKKLAVLGVLHSPLDGGTCEESNAFARTGLTDLKDCCSQQCSQHQCSCARERHKDQSRVTAGPGPGARDLLGSSEVSSTAAAEARLQGGEPLPAPEAGALVVVRLVAAPSLSSEAPCLIIDPSGTAYAGALAKAPPTFSKAEEAAVFSKLGAVASRSGTVASCDLGATLYIFSVLSRPAPAAAAGRVSPSAPKAQKCAEVAAVPSAASWEGSSSAATLRVDSAATLLTGPSSPLSRQQATKLDNLLWALLVAICVGNVFLFYIRETLTRRCSAAYWLLVGGSCIVPALLSILLRPRARSAASAEPVTSVQFQLVAYVTGTVAGVIGIGGGLILAPLLLKQGVRANKVSAINGAVVFIGSSAALLNFAISGMCDIGWASGLFLLCFAVSAVGKIGVDAMGSRGGAFVVAALFAMVVSSLVAVVACVVMDLVSDGSDAAMPPIRSLC